MVSIARADSGLRSCLLCSMGHSNAFNQIAASLAVEGIQPSQCRFSIAYGAFAVFSITTYTKTYTWLYKTYTTTYTLLMLFNARWRTAMEANGIENYLKLLF